MMGLLASPLSSTAMSQSEDSTGAQYKAENNDLPECSGAVERVDIGPMTQDRKELFATTGDTFRVSYRIGQIDNDDNNANFRVNIKEDNESIASQTRKREGSYSFLVSEGAGQYTVRTNVTPDRGAAYNLTVEDCTGKDDQDEDTDNNGGSSDGNTNEQGNNEDNLPQNLDDNNVADDNDIPDNVDTDTIPNNKLPNTGGPPILGLALFGGAGMIAVGSLIAMKYGLRRR